TARNVHEAAGRGERVHAVGIEHDERPNEVWTLGDLREGGADERHVLVNGRVLNDAEALANLGADVIADLPFFLVREGQVVELFFRILSLLRLLEGPVKAAELGKDRRSDRQECKNDHSVLHECASRSRPTTSKMGTGWVFPLTMTSPSGRKR